MSNESDLPLSVTLTMDTETRGELQQCESAIAIAEAYDIDSGDMAVAANHELREIKSRRERIETLRKSFIAPAQTIIANANALFNPALEALGRSEEILKQRLIAYQTEERRKADEERRRAEEVERKARQEAEAKAAAERAKAQADAENKRRMAEEAERVRAQAELEGKAKLAKQAAADAARLREMADQALSNGEHKAQQAQLAAAASVKSAVIVEPVKLDGFSTRDHWIAEIAPEETEDSAKAKLANAVTARPELISLLKIDMGAASKMAKALKKQFNVPGLVAVCKQIGASRS